MNVRVKWNQKRDGRISLLLESLRYAGVVGEIKTHIDEEVKQDVEFTIYAPTGVRDSVWAKMNAERMRSFMINAKAVS